MLSMNFFNVPSKAMSLKTKICLTKTLKSIMTTPTPTKTNPLPKILQISLINLGVRKRCSYSGRFQTPAAGAVAISWEKRKCIFGSSFQLE
jgi:hypothetical protein